ncbi:MAG: fibronectin type III domain-containing protein [Spirochaetales bacterium]|nr:fibronectin type III domain-containing protein [Spirochaetales bacterium]
MKNTKYLFYILLLAIFVGCKFGVDTSGIIPNTGSIGSNIGVDGGQSRPEVNIFAVENFRLSDSTPRSVRLSWDISPYAYKYVILRKLSSDKDFEIIAGNLSNRTTAFFDDRMQSGTDYVYRIQSRNSKNDILYESSDLKVKTAISPIGLSALGTTEPSIKLSWQWLKSWPTVSGFKIYRTRSRHSSEFESFVIPLSGLTIDSTGESSLVVSYVDSVDEADVGKFFYYEISAIYAGLESFRSNMVGSYGLSASAPIAPQNIVVSQGLYASKITISWDPVVEFDGASAAEYYQIYRKMPDSQNFEILANNLTDTNYVDSIAVQGEVEYFIIPVGRDEDDGTILMGEQSSVFKGWVIPVPVNFRATKLAYSSKIVLSWNGFANFDTIAEYKLFRSISSDMAGAEEVTSLTPTEDVMSYEDTTANVDTDYYYAVRIVSTAEEDNLGAFSLVDKGRAGQMPKPSFSASKGQGDTVTITCLSTNVDYKNYDIYRRYEYYQPLYEKKEKYAGELGDNYPDNYEQMLKYKVNPNRLKSSWEKIASDVTESSYSDSCQIDQVCGQTKARGPIEYKIVLKNFDDVASVESDVDTGYRALTNDEFLAEFLATIDRSQFKMVKIHLGGTGPAADDDVNGDVTGSLQYRPDFGTTVKVPIYYNNYRDYFMTLNDHPAMPQTSFASWSANGTLVGGDSVSGIYSGYVIFDIIVTDGRKSGGGYRVKNGSNPEVRITWDFDRAAVTSYLQTLP